MFSNLANTSVTMRTNISPLIVNPLYMLSNITFLAKSFSTLRTLVFASHPVNLTDMCGKIFDRDSTFWTLCPLVQVKTIQMLPGFLLGSELSVTFWYLTGNFLEIKIEFGILDMKSYNSPYFGFHLDGNTQCGVLDLCTP